MDLKGLGQGWGQGSQVAGGGTTHSALGAFERYSRPLTGNT